MLDIIELEPNEVVNAALLVVASWIKPRERRWGVRGFLDDSDHFRW
jgi:hypothetical protein